MDAVGVWESPFGWCGGVEWACQPRVGMSSCVEEKGGGEEEGKGLARLSLGAWLRAVCVLHVRAGEPGVPSQGKPAPGASDGEGLASASREIYSTTVSSSRWAA